MANTITEEVHQNLGNMAEEEQVYVAEDIQRRLRIGRSNCYTFLNKAYEEQSPFRVIKIGKLLRVPKQSFDNWLNDAAKG